MKKSILSGMLVGTMLMASVSVGAMGSELYGTLTTKNPMTSPPKGYAKTMGFKTITAKCTVTKGNTVKTEKKSKKAEKGGSVETDWLYGPTYSSSGTTFKSTHTGYNNSGVYQSLTATKKY